MSQLSWTIRSLLQWTVSDFVRRGVDTPRLDAELLVAEALGCDRIRLYLDLDRPLHAEELARIRGLVERRRTREPVSYILGRKDFWSRTFQVTKSVLVPRPDTETLVERALTVLDSDPFFRDRNREIQVLDLCTGSGIIAVTLAAERDELRLVASDVSESALDVARKNARCHGVEKRIQFVCSDLFESIPKASFDLVTINPPYIAVDELEDLAPEVREFEPRIALEAGVDGLEIMRRFIPQVSRWLKPGALLLMEIGASQWKEVQRLLELPREEGDDLVDIRVHRDLGGRFRVAEARCKPAP
ncbi:MAG: peptide chain release factor N(5)-glutamine methyltransferase [Myxococcota bacterium]